jgi:hypothetical protein
VKPQRPVEAADSGHGAANGSRDTGSILHLPEALRRCPEALIVVYNRASSYKNAGRGQVKLDDKTRLIVNQVRQVAPLRLTMIVSVVEKAKLSCPRGGLDRACEYAQKRGAMVVTSDRTRFFRPEAYDHRTNPDAVPTTEDWRLLFELTGGVLLATLDPTDLCESERQRLAMQRGAKPGRPRKIDDDLAARIFDDLGAYWWNDQWVNNRWDGAPVAAVAKKYGVGVATIYRMLTRLAPSGRTWEWEVRRMAEAQGLLKIREKGDGDWETYLP